jgi:hypothetical protein
MKKLILFAVFLPFATHQKAFKKEFNSTNLLEVRAGDWPINLEKNNNPSKPAFSLIFRDQQVVNGVMMDTLEFPDLGQLKYFGKALTVLKTGNNGDIAKFKDYSLKRAEKKYEGVWYILRIKFGLTDFRQPEADLMINTIKDL